MAAVTKAELLAMLQRLARSHAQLWSEVTDDEHGPDTDPAYVAAVELLRKAGVEDDDQ